MDMSVARANNKGCSEKLPCCLTKLSLYNTNRVCADIGLPFSRKERIGEMKLGMTARTDSQGNSTNSWGDFLSVSPHESAARKTEIFSVENQTTWKETSGLPDRPTTSIILYSITTAAITGLRGKFPGILDEKIANSSFRVFSSWSSGRATRGGSSCWTNA